MAYRFFHRGGWLKFFVDTDKFAQDKSAFLIRQLGNFFQNFAQAHTSIMPPPNLARYKNHRGPEQYS